MEIVFHNDSVIKVSRTTIYSGSK